MQLVISEKPSVAKSIADVLGAKSRKDGSYEGNGYVVSWCIGHLLGLAEPQAYNEKYMKWRYEDLPIIPDKWQYAANKDTKKQLIILCDLMKRYDVDCVINVCDAGREGELIFRLVYEYAKCKKPIKRLWISSMEESAISDGFLNLKDGTEYDNLYHSALCRQQADWAVGMNCSRLFSILYDTTLRVGRVQTPTLAMIVEREDKISNFIKEPFYIVEVSNDEFTAEREKVKDKQTAADISASCDGKTATITEVKRQEKSESPPKLYDLTTLQREANRLFGYTAAQTLNCVQNMYEMKIVTYPRTDSRYLTEDMKDGIPALVGVAYSILQFDGTPVINASQVINNAGVTDHHAIIPTPSMAKTDLSKLPTTEFNILNMICTRLVSAVSEKYVYAETVVTVDCNGEIFTAKGKTVIKDGWKAIEQSFIKSIGKNKKEVESSLPNLSQGQSFTAKSSVREGFTQPPKHYTEDLLLSAMETAGADDMPDDAERKGLGTPATRAAIIENLVKSEFLTRKDKSLFPTDKGVNLIKILPESVKSPMLTAEWENHLKRIEKNELSADDFMISINKFVSDLVKMYNTPSNEYKALFPSNKKTGEVIGKCPRCGNNVIEHPKGFFCDNNGCKFGLFKDNKFFTAKKKTITKEIAKTLLTEGRIFMSGLMSEKTGKPYNATIILDDKGEGYAGFKMEFEQKGAKS
ncbi:MAG: DNA topoisomerase 3 [Oscillospiraceae bacterium]|nr:DNA topoisomerase 3 [Oscillospiraceae bacterium]